MIRLLARTALLATALIALVPSVAVDAASTTVTASTNPIVKWNANVTGTLNLYPNYTAATGQTNASGIGSVVAATGAAFTGNLGCTPAPAQTANIIDFSNVQRPVTGTTACDYQNALSINVVTNDPAGWNVTETLGIAPGSGFALCALPNGTLHTGTPTTTSPMSASTVTGTTAGINETSCAGTGQLTLGTGNTVPTAQTIIPTGAGASGTFYMGQDVLLLLTSSTLSMGTYTDTMTVTLTLN